MKMPPKTLARLALAAVLSVALLTGVNTAAMACEGHDHGKQSAHSDHKHDHNHSHAPSDGPVDIYAAAMHAMHNDMTITPTGDADIDFMLGMIPHHQGAVDMAKILLEHGKDPEARKFAEEIIRAQESEISFMREWLKRNGHDLDAPVKNSAE